MSIYRRKIPSGGDGYMVANYATGKRRFDSYATESEAMEAANRLCRQLSERQVMAAGMRNEDAAEYAAAKQSLEPFKVNLLTGADTLARCLEVVRDLPAVMAAVKFYAARNKQVTQARR